MSGDGLAPTLNEQLDRMGVSLSRYLGVSVENLRAIFDARSDWEFAIKAAAVASLIVREFVFKELCEPRRGGLGGTDHPPVLRLLREYADSLDGPPLLAKERSLGILNEKDRAYLKGLYEVRNKYAHQFRFFDKSYGSLIDDVWPSERGKRIKDLCYEENEKKLPHEDHVLSEFVKLGFLRFLFSMYAIADLRLRISSEGGLLSWAMKHGGGTEEVPET